MTFQSLFFWNHCLDHPQESQSFSQAVVSILVFLEPLLRRDQECFLQAFRRVSILVFLEPLLRHFITIINFTNNYRSFNSCFSGTTA